MSTIDRKPLGEAFIAHVDPKRRDREITAALEATLAGCIAEARAAWPKVDLDTASFLKHLAERLPAEGTVTAALGALTTSDLYLACACSQGNATAVAAFREAHAQRIAIAVRKVGSEHLVDEITQQLLMKFFVGSDSRAAQIGKYTGRGSLGAWVQVVAFRDTHSEARKRPKEQLSEMGMLVERAIESEDEDLLRIKQLHRKQFKEVFARAVETLSPRQRNILRFQYLDGLNIDKIGAMYGVHRGTVARWRARARVALFEETRRIFREELNVETRELDSILRLIQSQLDVSLPRLLDDADA